MLILLVVIREHIVEDTNRVNLLCSPIQGETHVALLAIQLAISLSLSHFILKCDSFIVILAL